MKVLSFIFLSLFALISGWYINVDGDYQEYPESVAYEEFINVSIQYYDSYFLLKNRITSDYVYAVVLGVKDDNQYYDVFLYNVKSSSYALRVKIDNDEYSVAYKKENCYYQNGIINNGKNKISVYMFNGYSKVEEVEIPSDYRTVTTAVHTGDGNGVVVSYLDPIKGFNGNFAMIILIATILIFACLISLGVVYVLKRGKKNIGPATYKEESPFKFYYNPNNDDYRKEEEKESSIEVEVVTDDINRVDDLNMEEEKETKEKSYYEEISEFKDETSESDEDNDSKIDIKTLLIMKGYRTDYANMSVEEKNEVMVGLMILKNSGQIGDNTYYKEVANLWKN